MMLLIYEGILTPTQVGWLERGGVCLRFGWLHLLQGVALEV